MSEVLSLNNIPIKSKFLMRFYSISLRHKEQEIHDFATLRSPKKNRGLFLNSVTITLLLKFLHSDQVENTDRRL
jgi:hypothetical protein